MPVTEMPTSGDLKSGDLLSILPPPLLKGHCHGNFAIFWSKPLKYLTESLFFNMKLLIQHWEENTKVFFSEEQTIVIF